ncbi:MAG: hypothetical protein VYC01_02095 [Nitrospinota bacterium]|nr:hypothetical protein [Nitrospinota bacterium]
MRKFWRLFGWVFLGIFLQFKFNVLYGIVFLENLNFHDRTYLVEMKMISTEESLRILKVKTTVHHSLGPDYFANVYIPENYKVLNETPYAGAEVLPGYIAYKMNMKRKYRDVLGQMNFIIAPKELKIDVPAKPIKVHFENLKQRLHSDETYQVSTLKLKTKLEGPEVAETIYPQKLGM